MDKLQVGIATFHYNNKGELTSAQFIPTTRLEALPDLLKQFESIKGTQPDETIRQNAALLMAGWFSNVANMELADREKYEMVAHIMEKQYYESTDRRACLRSVSVAFEFKER